jgi:DNA-binding NarL/FixJ family response regulator
MNRPDHRISIAIADDHAIFRKGLIQHLAQYPNFFIVNESENGRELLSAVSRCRPDVVIIDINMPVMDGIEACRAIDSKFPTTKIIGLSISDEEKGLMGMIDSGASGFLLKTSCDREIVDAIYRVTQGAHYYCTTVSKKITRILVDRKQNPFSANGQPAFSLREKEIINLMCEQYSNKEIAVRLGLSVRTVENHRDKIQHKMSVKNLAGVVVFAVRHRIYQLD